jgi:hypothetical protein
MGGTYRANEREEKRMQSFVRKTEGRKPLRRARRKWEDSIKMNLKDLTD